MAADLEAEAGSDTALPLIEQLRAYQPAEADTILATLRLRQSRFDGGGGGARGGVCAVTASTRGRICATRRRRSPSRSRSADAIRPPREACTRPCGNRSACSPLDDMRLMTMTELSARFDFAGACVSRSARWSRTRRGPRRFSSSGATAIR